MMFGALCILVCGCDATFDRENSWFLSFFCFCSGCLFIFNAAPCFRMAFFEALYWRVGRTHKTISNVTVSDGLMAVTSHPVANGLRGSKWFEYHKSILLEIDGIFK